MVCIMMVPVFRNVLDYSGGFVSVRCSRSRNSIHATQKLRTEDFTPCEIAGFPLITISLSRSVLNW